MPSRRVAVLALLLLPLPLPLLLLLPDVQRPEPAGWEPMAEESQRVEVQRYFDLFAQDGAGGEWTELRPPLPPSETGFGLPLDKRFRSRDDPSVPPLLPSATLRSCLAGKSVLFFGDSLANAQTQALREILSPDVADPMFDFSPLSRGKRLRCTGKGKYLNNQVCRRFGEVHLAPATCHSGRHGDDTTVSFCSRDLRAALAGLGAPPDVIIYGRLLHEMDGPLLDYVQLISEVPGIVAEAAPDAFKVMTGTHWRDRRKIHPSHWENQDNERAREFTAAAKAAVDWGGVGWYWWDQWHFTLDQTDPQRDTNDGTHFSFEVNVAKAMAWAGAFCPS